jgi:hypothetical protein
MTTPLTPPSPTGRLNVSEPEQQYFPGTPQAEAQKRRMREALAKGHPIQFLDFSSLEDRIDVAAVQAQFGQKA